MTNEQTPTEEAEDLVDGVVDDGRTEVVEEHEETIQNLVEEIETYREMNVVFSEVRRRLE